MPVLLDLTLAGWAVFELGLRVRESVQSKGATGQDRATRLLIAAAIGGAIVLTALTANRASSLRMPGPHRAAGLIVMWLGLAIRVWAVAALGRRSAPRSRSTQVKGSCRAAPTGGCATPPTPACC